MNTEKQAKPQGVQQERYRFIFDSTQLDRVRERFERLANDAVRVLYGPDAGRRFSVESGGWDSKFHLVLREIRLDPKKCVSVPLSDLFSPDSRLRSYILNKAQEYGFNLIDAAKLGFEDDRTKHSFLLLIPGAGMLRV